MKNRVLFTLLCTLMICVLSVTAFGAATLTYTLEEVEYLDTGDAALAIVARGTLVDEADFLAYQDIVELDTTVLVPVDAYYGDVLTDLEGEDAEYPFELGQFPGNRGKLAPLSYPASPVWTVGEGTAEYRMEVYWSSFDKYPITEMDNAVIYYLYVAPVDGKEITADAFTVKSIKLVDSDVTHTFGVDGSEDNLTVENELPVPAAPTKLTIAVAAGDVVYLQDGTVVEIAEANEAYEIPTTAGTVVVNSGFEGQKVYTVADNKVTEDTAKADGVLSTGEASIRGDKEETSGIRFKSTFLTALKDAVDEYGYLTTVESAKTGLAGTDYVLNMALFEAGKAVKDEAYIKGTDVDTFWNVEDDKTVVTAVVTNVPKTKEGVTTNIVIRPYYKVGEFVVYGEPMTRTVYEVALNIMENDAETYAKYQTYIDTIIALLAEEDKDVVIDFGPLFK